MSLVRTFLAVLLPALFLAALLVPAVLGLATRPTRQLLEGSSRRAGSPGVVVGHPDMSSHRAIARL